MSGIFSCASALPPSEWAQLGPAADRHHQGSLKLWVDTGPKGPAYQRPADWTPSPASAHQDTRSPSTADHYKGLQQAMLPVMSLERHRGWLWPPRSHSVPRAAGVGLGAGEGHRQTPHDTATEPSAGVWGTGQAGPGPAPLCPGVLGNPGTAVGECSARGTALPWARGTAAPPPAQRPLYKKWHFD